MKVIGYNKIKWLAVAAIVLITIFVLWYWPFVKMEDFVSGKNEQSISDEYYQDKVDEILDYLKIYPLCCFIHKGDKYSDVPLIDKDNIPKKVDISFNWDNSVTISEGTEKFNLHVTRIWIEPQLFPFSDKNYPLKLHENRDSLFVGIFMYDDNNNEIDVYRQKRTMPLGGRRVGFRINIDGKVFVTGANERFQY